MCSAYRYQFATQNQIDCDEKFSKDFNVKLCIFLEFQSRILNSSTVADLYHAHRQNSGNNNINQIKRREVYNSIKFVTV